MTPVTEGTFRVGMIVAIGVTFAILVALNALEAWCAYKNWPSLGYRVEQWSAHNPWYVGLVFLVLGTFLAHFFLNPLSLTGT
jgi:hypothetical protein